MARSDDEIKRDVEEELLTDPMVEAIELAVAVRDGVVTLTGWVPTYLAKLDAEDAALRVAGVAGVANDLKIHVPPKERRLDADIAHEALTRIRRRVADSDRIRVVVEDGVVRLEGEVPWLHAKEGAQRAVRRVKGVTDVKNLLRVVPRMTAPPEDSRRRIEAAFRRNAALDENRITVRTDDGGAVTLEGAVGSWAARREAERAAAATPGATRIDNRLAVDRR